MSASINGTTGVTYPDGSTQATAATSGLVNKIINGRMEIDQRNAGASVTQTTSGLYTLDRWKTYGAAASKFKVQQNAGSVTPPVGFANYLGVTSTSAYSVASTDEFDLYQPIEGFNTADLGWGAAGAASVMLSFWVRSSLTGTFGGSVRNSTTNYSYPFSYTINAANTWEQKSITIVGPTSGTWIGATNGIGMLVNFSMGAGSILSGTAGSWSANNYTSATGATSVVGTNGATFYITGVDLRKGTVAPSTYNMDWRPYGLELALCQRYYEKSYEVTTAPATNTTNGLIYGYGSADGIGKAGLFIRYASLKRTTPTFTVYTQSGTSGQWGYERSGSNGTVACTTGGVNGTSGTLVYAQTSATAYAGLNIWGHFTSEAEL